MVVKARRRTISARRARVRGGCTFTSGVAFRERRRFAGARELRLTVRMLGDGGAQVARSRTVRLRLRARRS